MSYMRAYMLGEIVYAFSRKEEQSRTTRACATRCRPQDGRSPATARQHARRAPVSNSVSNPAFRALSAIRCLSCSSCASCRTWFAIWINFPLGLNRSVRPTLSFGAPSNPLSAAAADEVDAYGFALDSVGAMGTGAGGGVGAFRTLACDYPQSVVS